MKKLSMVFFVMLVMAGCQPKSSQKDAGTDPVTMELSIEGMTCNGCVGTVEASVRQMGEGIDSVAVSLDSARAIVQFVPAKVTLDEIRDAIEINGYKVTKAEEK